MNKQTRNTAAQILQINKKYIVERNNERGYSGEDLRVGDTVILPEFNQRIKVNQRIEVILKIQKWLENESNL